MKKLIAPMLLAAALLAGSAAAGTLNVPGDYALINDAVQACAAGDTVLVAPGTYNDCTHPTGDGDTTKVCVYMRSGVTLRGSGSTATIIDAQSLGRGVLLKNVTGCRVENLGITGGFADNHGAAILATAVDLSVEVTDVRIFDNLDGGIICLDSASPTLRRVDMVGNHAKQGGGLSIEENCSPEVYDCLIDDNTAPSGAGVFIRNGCAPIIDGCVITNNSITESLGSGGGIAVQDAAPTIRNCEITDNYSQGYGGGVSFSSGASGSLESSFIARNEVESNTSTGGGGVATSESGPTLSHLVIVDNTASGYNNDGGGVFILFGPAPTVESCTIVGNACHADSPAGGVSVRYFVDPVITNCIIAGSTVGAGTYCLNATPTFVNCDVWNNAGGDAICGTDGGGNISADPLFCGTVGSEYNIAPGSPCAPANHSSGTLVGALPATSCSSPAPLPGLQSIVLGNRPNPFNPSTTIFFDLPTDGPATLRIYDLAGRLIQTRTWDDLPAGRTEFQWNGKDRQGYSLPSGIYLYQLNSRALSSTQRMSLIR